MTDKNQNMADEAKAAAESAAEYTKAFEAEFAKLTQADPEKSTAADPGRYTIEFAFEQLEKVRSESLKFAVETREKISEIRSAGPEDVGAQAAGEAMRALIQEQGHIYRQLIDFYIGMISDPKNDAFQKKTERQQYLDFVRDCIAASEPGEALPDFAMLWNVINA